MQPNLMGGGGGASKMIKSKPTPKWPKKMSTRRTLDKTWMESKPSPPKRKSISPKNKKKKVSRFLQTCIELDLNQSVLN